MLTKLEDVIRKDLESGISLDPGLKAKLESSRPNKKVVILGGYRLPPKDIMDELTKLFRTEGWDQLEFRSNPIFGTWAQIS